MYVSNSRYAYQYLQRVPRRTQHKLHIVRCTMNKTNGVNIDDWRIHITFFL